jgi:serine phosphatase RsbU (regulator of sigma subunit)/putative methionine-R-sulfoxide reductase with GAF domain
LSASKSSPWKQIVRLGEHLLETSSLADQRDRLVLAAEALFNGRAELWLDENLFRLPGLNQDPLFPSQPSDEFMRRACETGKPCFQDDTPATAAAVPLQHKDVLLGVLRVERPGGPPFRKADLELLNGFAGHAALALTTAHRIAVEQWRIEQLTLVRKVGAQIANVSDVDELARRVSGLIQETFKVYFVAVFTCDASQERLRFRSSAGPAGRRGKRRNPPVLEVKFGEGLIGIVAQSGEEIVSNDVSAEPRFRYIDRLPETLSEVVLPLKIEDRVLGVLDIQSDRLNAFHPNDLLVLRALADNIAIAFDGARLYTALQKRAEQLSLASEVSADITSILDLDELLNRVVTLIQDRLGYPYVHLFTVHPNRRQIIYEAGKGERSQALKGYVLDLDDAEGILSWVAREGQTVVANDVSQEPRYRPSPFPPEDTLAEMAVPLVYNNRVVGVLDLQSDRVNVFTEEDRFLFETLADNIAVALHNADLYRSERWRRQVADSLREVTGLLSAKVSVDDVLDATLRELERNLPSDVLAIWLLDGDELYLAHIHGADPLEVEDAKDRWPETGLFLASSLSAEQPTIRKPADPFGPIGVACGFAADYSSIAAALRLGDQPLGVLTLAHHTPRRYGHEAQAVTATFANYAAVAIENARLYDSAQEQAYASAALLQVAQTAANSNSLDEILASIVRITPMLVGVKACGIYLWEAQTFRSVQAYGFPEDVQPVLEKEAFAPGEFPLLDSVRERSQTAIGLLEPSIPEDWLDTELALSEEDTYYFIQSGKRLLIGFPLMIKGDLYGVMLVEETSEAFRFRQKRIEIITGIAQQVALSIQNEHLQREMVARERLEHEIQLARQIQQTFLPERLPEYPDWELAALWKTARQVGGDFYDVIELPDKQLGLFIADVSDKGIPAALFMALTRTLVRAAVSETSSPAEALQRVNNLIIPDNQQEMFVTAVYAVLSLKTGELTYANAGHNPPLWMRNQRSEIESLTRTGMALGVVEGTLIEERTIQLEPGDNLLLYTDGLTEAFSPQEELFGVERLHQLIQANLTLSAHELLGTIEAAVNTYMGSLLPDDDLTMLAVRRKVSTGRTG